MTDRLELRPDVFCPVCQSLLNVEERKPAYKKRRGSTDDEPWSKTYIVDCGNQRCEEYRKIKFLPARYVEVESHEIE